MATQATVAVATSAVLVFTAPKHGTVTIKNEDASIIVFVGGSTVTNSGSTAGVSLAGKATISIPVVSGEKIYVSSASATPNVSYLFSS